ncbi:protein-glutamate methylesterase/protein-glutamine glutaminase [Pseudoxanthomonas composti]|uniref:Protein-glutamate methylesterase/protein-glutamine glutaminase n=1 Tax=Pseudoxanthomonas composti TaxID=2137479 RepID=A0A4Q1JYY7_9GAMM|nr:chemotaxis response regulator protein-glutamate methylesterase [Pseudoxanthomonas composti]RXR06644.1 chemotaxis response regulator protein-glutamate methylesterase [Pseudoxanthomonas composti]
MSLQAPCRVLIVDDSAVVRQLLTEILSRDRGIEVVGSATDPFMARDMIKRLNPDVITLDVEMPRMDGVTFLQNLMRLRPMPVVMISSLTEQGADITLQALALGAVDFITKPKLGVSQGLEAYSEEIIAKVKAAAKARVQALTPSQSTKAQAVAASAPLKFRTTDRLIAIGASAGGTEAIRVVLEMMPPDAPAIVVSQHIPAAFSRPFVERLDRHSAMAVREATEGEMVVPGHVYLPPGDRHLEIVRDGARWRCHISDAGPVNRHRPSVEVMFKSVERAAGANAVVAMLTGMGDDGSRALLELRQAGAATICQDEATSVVWGMPGTAVKLGAAQEVLPLHKIAGRLLELAAQPRNAAA